MEKKETTITADNRLSLSFLGPPLREGPCPAVLYLALSKEESLTLSPINQPALFLSSYPIRVFSLTLPKHEHAGSRQNAIALWAEELQKENDIISSFADKAKNTLEYLVKEKIALPDKMAVMGISRGAYMAFHLAAKVAEIKWVLAFAPLLQLSELKEFANKDFGLIETLHPNNLIPALTDKEIRIYIGNRDIKVGTKHAFAFIEKLTEEAVKQKKKNSPAELIIYPSIGHKGHGTSNNIFKEGSLWLKEKLLPS